MIFQPWKDLFARFATQHSLQLFTDLYFFHILSPLAPKDMLVSMKQTCMCLFCNPPKKFHKRSHHVHS